MVAPARGWRALASVALAGTLATGCFAFARSQSYKKEYLHRVPKARILTEGVEIAAEDGSFKWTSGAAFDTPARCVGDSNDALMEIFPWENKGNFLSESYQCVGASATSYPAALKHGALRVRVRHPGLADPLYGVLMLNCELSPNGATNVPLRIEVPQSYVDATTDGRTSLVYEKEGACEAKWGLWLSRAPFKEGAK